MMKSASVAALALILAACGSGDAASDGTATGGVSADDALAQVESMTKPLPGQYRTQFELVDLTVPGIPAEQIATMRTMFADSVANIETSCLSAQEAEQGFEEMVRQLGESNGDAQCTIDSFDADGGTLDAALSCAPKSGVTANMTVNGDIAPEKSVMTMAINTKAANIPGGEMTMSIRTTANRLGDCPT